MTDMQAALGLSQLGQLDRFLDRRRSLADAYDVALRDLPVLCPGRQAGALSAWHLYVLRLQDRGRHRAVFEGLRAAGIGVNLHYIPVHLQPYYRALGFAPGDFPVAEDYYDRAISIPLFAGMTEAEQGRVVDAIHNATEN